MWKCATRLLIFLVCGTCLGRAATVDSVLTIAALRIYTGTASTVNVAAYSAAGDGGGGVFVQNGTSCSDDSGIVIQESVGTNRCWYRQFSGPVHLLWYGVPDAGSYGCYSGGFTGCDATGKLKDALKAADVLRGLGGDGGVSTDGRSIALLTKCDGCEDGIAVEIKQDQYLTCDGPPGVSRGQGDDVTPGTPFYTLPHSLVLNPALTIKRYAQSRLSNCIIRPTWYYPDNPELTIPATNVRQTVDIVRAFKGTATTCIDRACNMDNMFILGFDVCDDASNAKKSIIKDVVEACLVNEWLHDNGGGMKLQNFVGGPFLENGFHTEAQFQRWNVTHVQQSGTDDVQVTVDASGDNIPAVDDTVLISGLGNGTVAPVSANGRWLVASVSGTGPYNVVLIGASWAGPTYTGSSWKAGVPAITVYDTTNIIPGQYVCASGTAPFCTPPTGFTLSTAAQLASGITGAQTGNVGVTGSLQGWPVSGLMKIDSENIRYAIVNANTIDITERGAQGTSHSSHSGGAPITAAAPVVVGVAPTSNVVIVSAPAQSTGSGSATFANDTRVVDDAHLGDFALNPSYHTWTSTQGAGPNPSGTLTVYADGGGTSITSVENCFKVQPGMKVYDVTASTSLPDVTAVDCSTNTLTVAAVVPFSFTSHKLRFTGCGYPGFGATTTYPWLGNCAATSVLLGKVGNTDGDDPNDGPDEQAQGVACEYVHTSGSEIAFHTLDAPATSCVNFVVDDNGPTGAQADPGSVAMWMDGKATKSQFSNGRLGGYYTSILNTPTFQPDGVAVSNAQVYGNIILGEDSNIGLSLLHGQINAPGSGFVFASSAIQAAHIDSAQLPQWSLYVDDANAWPKLFCAANLFAGALCTQVRSAPACVSGCSSIAGNDSSFDVAVSGGTTISVTLAGQYSSAPICTESPATSGGGAAVSASVTSVDWEPWGTTVSFKISAAASHLYGSCHGVTG